MLAAYLALACLALGLVTNHCRAKKLFFFLAHLNSAYDIVRGSVKINRLDLSAMVCVVVEEVVEELEEQVLVQVQVGVSVEEQEE